MSHLKKPDSTARAASEQDETSGLLTLKSTAEDHQVAKLAAMAIALHLMESVIPSPIPGVKPGVSNIITLLVLYRYGWKSAVWVSLLRVLAGSLLLGQFLSTTFLLSLSGAGASLLILRLFKPNTYFGPISVSLVSAIAHIFGQLLLVRVWLIPNDGVFYLIPILMMFAMLFGLINGMIVTVLIRQIKQP